MRINLARKICLVSRRPQRFSEAKEESAHLSPFVWCLTPPSANAMRGGVRHLLCTQSDEQIDAAGTQSRNVAGHEADDAEQQRGAADYQRSHRRYTVALCLRLSGV